MIYDSMVAVQGIYSFVTSSFLFSTNYYDIICVLFDRYSRSYKAIVESVLPSDETQEVCCWVVNLKAKTSLLTQPPHLWSLVIHILHFYFALVHVSV